MQRIRRSSLGSTTSLRRSSISAKDIQAIQLALQKQQRISNQFLLFITIFLPIFSFIYLYAIHFQQGYMLATMKVVFGRSFLLHVIPPITDIIAWKFLAILFSVQLIFHWVLPHDDVIVLSSIKEYRRAVNGFSSCLLLCLLYLMGSGLGLYRGDTVFIHFNAIVLYLALICVCIMATLVLTYRFGEDYNITTLSDFFFGVEIHPKVLDIDIKHFLRSRITFGLWPLFVISALFYQRNAYGQISMSLLGCSFVQMTYIMKFHWNEYLHLNALDSRRANCGFYRVWGDLVFYPIIYSSPLAIIAYSRKTLSILTNAIYVIIGLFAIYTTTAIDKQKYDFRRSKGMIKIGGVDPFFITAKYRLDTGDSAANLLLGSGYWSSCRHPNYLFESITFVSFSLFQGFAPALCHLPAIFITGFLFVRLLSDESRCLAKYGQYWIQYCNKVPYRVLPGIY